jgi:hypothetical protein
VIGNLLIVEISGNIISYHLFHWLSLHIGLSVCFLVSCLDCLFFLAVGYVCEAAIQSLHFLFFISKKTKTLLILNYGIFSFDYLVLILTHVERLHFIEIVEIAFKILPSLENLRLQLRNIFIFISLIC